LEPTLMTMRHHPRIRRSEFSAAVRKQAQIFAVTECKNTGHAWRVRCEIAAQPRIGAVKIVVHIAAFTACDSAGEPLKR
jgi:hypothetical protein